MPRTLTIGPALRVLALAAALLLGSACLAAAQSGLDVMRQQRELQRATDEVETSVMKIYSRAGEVKERRLVSYALTPARGLAKTLLRFLAPRDIENTALLTWEGRDGHDDQWLYLPATRKVKRIAASAKKTRFMGTDFSYEDLRPENLALHVYAVAGSESVDGHDCHVVEARPATERQATDSGYSRRTLWIRKDTYATVKQEFYDRTGRLEKVGVSRSLVNVKGTLWRAREIEMRDVQMGTRTVMMVESQALDTGLRDSFFTEAELTRGGR
ncbi:MAG: outer membrane lipoprotein-sorting protein [Candidatus Rokuibacteriota bacterium]